MIEYLSLAQLIKMSADDLIVLKYRCEKYLRIIDEVIEQRYLVNPEESIVKKAIDIPISNPVPKQKPIKKISGKKRGRKPGIKNKSEIAALTLDVPV